MASDERFDGLFLNAVQQSQGIDNFFNNLFGFMRRKTDFYQAEDMSRDKIMQHFEANLAIYKNDKAKADKLKAKKEADERAKKAAAEAKKKEEDSQVRELTAEEIEQIEKEEKAKKESKKAEPVVKNNDEETKEGEKKEEDKGKAPNDQNGGMTDKYNWGQTLQELTVNIPLPDGTTSKMLIVDFTKSKLKVAIKGQQEAIIAGELCKPIKVDDSMWVIETDSKNRRVLQLTLTKKDQMGWWECVVQGDEKIDTSKVSPENSKLSDLDGETRSTVEKMMFDQNQKQKGLPSSDELEKRSKLEEFMKAHPEMDFSKAKFS